MAAAARRPDQAQVNLLLSDAIDKELQDYWHAERFRSKGEAVRHLVAVALTLWREGDERCKRPV